KQTPCVKCAVIQHRGHTLKRIDGSHQVYAGSDRLSSVDSNLMFDLAAGLTQCSSCTGRLIDYPRFSLSREVRVLQCGHYQH
ncbi:hypothetical protein PMAYCL1PPCAC_03704, partial [Pristionchus mayeri]